MRVSVVITAWNAEQFIGEALDSVMAQTRPVHQIVVNDDGSTDGTVAAVEAVPGPIELLRSPHEGISEGRNRALGRATGDVVAFLDADDLWLPEKLARQCQVLADHPEVDAVYARTDEFSDETTAGHRTPRQGAVGPLVSGTIVRSTTVASVGPFQPGLGSGDWIEWWGRAVQLGLVAIEIPEVLVRRRLHGENNSVRERSSADFLGIVRAQIERSRGGTG